MANETKKGMGIGAGIAAGAAETILGMALQPLKYRMQYKQAGKLQDLQLQGNKEMADYNQQLALDTWDKTNYSAQIGQMKKAGLNPGLMYGMGGGGGATTGGSGGGVSGQTAQMPEIGGGMGIALQALATAAEVKLKEAQARNTDADTANKPKEGAAIDQSISESGARILKLTAETENEKAKLAGINYGNRILELEGKLKEMSMEDVARALKANAEKLVAEAEVAEKTKGELITQAKQNTAEQVIRMAAMKAGISKTEVDTAASRKSIEVMAGQIQTMMETNAQNWDKLSQKDREIQIAKELQKFTTSLGAQTGQWTQAIKDVAIALAAISSGGR